MSNKRVNFHSAVIFSLVLLISGCGGGASDDDDNNPQTPPVITDPQTNNAGGQVYSDNFLQLNYPDDWTLSTDSADLSAQLFDSVVNEFGGNANCGIDSTFDPSISLIEATDDILDLFDDTPAPQTSFIEISGVPAARVSGNLTLFGITLETTAQLVHEDDINFVHLVLCAGVDEDDLALILNTMQLL